MMPTTIESRWQALTPAPDKPIFQLLDAEHPLKLYIGREMTGGNLFLVVDPEQPPAIKSMRSVQISSSQRADGQWTLLLKLRQPELEGVFALLCQDLSSCSKHLPRGGSGMKFVSRRLANWRKLMEEGGTGLLSGHEVRGLYGELRILDSFFLEKFKADEAVKAWVGPFGADQDFQFHEQAWEVKTTHVDAPLIQIASEKQLYSSERKILLIVMSLEESTEDNSLSLNALVERIRFRIGNQSEARDALEERLISARYIARAEYESPLFKVGLIRIFRVEDEFPRLTPHDIRLGVSDVRYQILLESCRPFETDSLFGESRNESR